MKRLRVRWTRSASDDLLELMRLVQADRPLMVEPLLARIEAAASRLASFPKRGRVVPELKWHGIDRYREVQEPPWRLIYRVEEEEVVVLALLDGRRRLEQLLLDRLLR